MKTLIALSIFDFGGRYLAAGQSFEAEDEEARILLGTGQARAAAVLPRTEPAPVAAAPRARTRYHRRDLQAGD